MAQTTKYLYETIVNREVTEQVSEQHIEDGKTITTTSPIIKVKKIKIAIQQPDRRLYKGAELFYSKTLAVYLKEGLMPYSLVAKRYANDNGPLTDAEIKRLGELKDELKVLEKEFFTTITSVVNGDSDEVSIGKKGDILLKINAVNSEVSAIQNAYSDIFDNTAEMKSRNDTIEWWSLFLINVDEDNKGYKPLFGIGDPNKQEDFQKKIAKLEEIEEKNDPFYNEVVKMGSYLISFWFTARTSLTKEDFKTMEKVYKDSLSTYKVLDEIVEEKPEVVAEKKEETVVTPTTP